MCSTAAVSGARWRAIARQQKAAMTGFRIHHHLLELDDADPLFVRTLHVGRGLREPGAAELSDRVQRDDESDRQRDDDCELPALQP